MDTETQIAELKAELAQEKEKNSKSVKVKIGNKRNVSVYGLGQRFPVTLYAPGWEILIDNIDLVKDFIEEHRDELSWER